MASNPFSVKFDQLNQLIEKRQHYENEHPYPPYSTHLTTMNYPDKNGLTLLDYAIRLGQIDRVQELISKGAQVKNPLQLALRSNQLELAQYFFASNPDFSSIKLSTIRHEPCRGWFIQLIRKTLNSIQPNAHPFFQYSSKRSFITLPHRAAEVGDLDFLKQCLTKSYFEFASIIDSLLISAIENHQNELVSFLLEQGASATPDKLYKDSPMTLAALSKNKDGILLLLEQNADINYPGREKKTALMIAVLLRSRILVTTLLSHHADCLMTDAYGRTALHYAAMNPGSVDLVSQLLLAPSGSEALFIRDIYGNTPRDYAQESQDHALIELVDPGHCKKISSMTKPHIDIDQSVVMQNLKYYLISQYRDLEFFNEDGHCNGLAFLHDIYTNKGMESWFYNTLELIASWDGSEEALTKEFDDGVVHKAYYKNLGELFEQWTNDIIWYQHSKLDSVFNYSLRSKRQGNREFQHCITGELNQKPVLISRYQETLNTQCLLENIEIFRTRLPLGCRLELSGSTHATSAFLLPDKTIGYYDSNLPRKTRPFIDAEDFSDAVIDTKLILLNQLNAWGNNEFDNELRLFYYHSPEMETAVANHEVFAENEFPTSVESVDLFQKRSPNQYTPLHVAVLTGSISTVSKLMARNNELDLLYKRDKHGNTAMDIAVSSGNRAIMEVLAKEYPDKTAFPMEHMIKQHEIAQAYHEKDNPMLEFFMAHHAKLHLEPLFFAAVNHHDLPLLSRMLENRMVDVNTPFAYNLAINLAIMAQDISMLQLFLQHQASLTIAIPDSSYYSSPLYHIYCCSNELLEIICPYLIPSINQLDEYGNALLHYIAIVHHEITSTLRAVLEKHADFNQLNAEGKTALELVIDQPSLSQTEKISLAHWLLPKMELHNLPSESQHRLFVWLEQSNDDNLRQTCVDHGLNRVPF